MNTNVTAVREQHIVKTTELQLPRVRTRQCKYANKKLKELLTTDIQTKLEAISSSDEMAETDRLLVTAHKPSPNETRSRQFHEI